MADTATSITILFVEDDVQVRKTTCDMLQRLGFNVVIAQSPEEAITICSDDDTIDLLMTDMVMPEMSGTQLKDQILSVRPGIKVLFVSGHPVNIISQEFTLKREDHFIQKPYSLKELADKIEQVVGG